MSDPVQLPPQPSLASRVGTSLFHRVIVSKGWTILGLVGAGLVEAFNESVLPTLIGSSSPYLHGLAVLIATYGATKLSPAAVQAWAAKKQAEQDSKDAPPASGFIAPAILVAIMVGCLVALLAPRMARADDPKFGGCLVSHPGTCFAPAVSVNVLAIRISDGSMTSTFDPGVGYGVTFASDKWYRTGVSLTFSFPTFEAGRRIQPAGVVSFAEYGRFGVACPMWVAGGFQRNAQLLLGFGADFGKW